MSTEQKGNDKPVQKKKKPKGYTGKGGHSQIVTTWTETVIDENGNKKKHTHSYYGATMKEAVAKKEEAKRLRNINIDVDAGCLPVSYYVDKWLVLKSGKNMRVNNARAKDIKKYLGDRPINSVRRSDIQKMMNDYITSTTIRGSAPQKKSVESLRYVTAQVFDMAVLDRIIELTPVQKIEIPTFQKSKIRALDDKEVNNILKLNNKYQYIFIILLYSGLRRGELIPLKWKDINFDEKYIDVNKAVIYNNNRPIVKNTPKTAAGNRKVFLTEQFVEYLKKVKLDQADNLFGKNIVNMDDKLVCPAPKMVCKKNAEGKEQWVPVPHQYVMYSETAWTNMLHSFHVAYELKYGNPEGYNVNSPKFRLTLQKINPHMLRHTFCCSMFYAGVPVNIAQRQMGHEKASTTLNIYAQCESEKKVKEEINKKMSKKKLTPEEKLLMALFGQGEYPEQLLNTNNDVF